MDLEGASCEVVNEAGLDRADSVVEGRFFFLMRLPPRLEVPRMHCLLSFLQRPHGGVPPEASLEHDQSHSNIRIRWMNGKAVL